MDTSSAQLAVNLALSGKWNEAVDANLQILQTNPEDTEALCRLARAYAELGKIKDARATTNKVLDLDPTNQIAGRFLEKLKLAKNTSSPISSPTCNESFLEEPGKTKIVQLMNLCGVENFVNLDPGEEVKLAPYSHRVTITTLDGKYIGRLPDDLSARIKFLLKSGNKFQILIKSVTPKGVTIFIRETEKSPDLDGSPSFPPEKIEYVSFTPPELVHSDMPDVETTEEIPEE